LINLSLGASSSLSTNLLPLLLDFFEFLPHVGVPHGTHKEKNKASIGAKDSKEPTNEGQTPKGFIVAIRKVFGTSRPRTCRPQTQIKAHVSRQISHHKKGSRTCKHEGTVLCPPLPFFRRMKHVGIKDNHERQRHTKGNVVTKCSCCSGDGTTEQPDH